MPAAPAASRGQARPARVTEPLTPRRQLCQDITIALGPVATALALAAALHRARLIPLSWNSCLLALVAVPLAAFLWRKAAGTAPPPPASPARRALTRAAAALTVLTAAAGTTVVLVLIRRHAPVTWWDLPVPAAVALVPLLAAGSARRRHAPVPSSAAGSRRAA